MRNTLETSCLSFIAQMGLGRQREAEVGQEPEESWVQHTDSQGPPVVLALLNLHDDARILPSPRPSAP